MEALQNLGHLDRSIYEKTKKIAQLARLNDELDGTNKALEVRNLDEMVSLANDAIRECDALLESLRNFHPQSPLLCLWKVNKQAILYGRDHNATLHDLLLNIRTAEEVPTLEVLRARTDTANEIVRLLIL